ncbi:RtcB family protein [Patescibacteria group bacterium]
MSDFLSTENSHMQKFQAPEMKIPTLFHTSKELLPNQETFDQLNNLAKDERLFHHIAAMSDVHPKKGRKNPTGTVVTSEKHLFPQINDTAPNCGMRFVRTDLDENSLPTEKIDELFKEFIKVIPTKKYLGTKLSLRDVLEVCKYGSRPLQEKFKTRTKNEIENTFEGGNLMTKENVDDEDIFNSIPKLFLHTGKYRTGILGAAGNHFLDLMKITEIRDNEIAQKFNLKVGQYIFLIHTGSGLIGQYASYMYTPKKKEHLSQQVMFQIGTTFFNEKSSDAYKKIKKMIKEYEDKDEFLGYEANSTEGRMYLTAHEAAGNFGFANRLVLNHHLDHALEKVLGRQIDLNLLYDMPHIMNRKENHFGKDVWTHRNGTVRANGPERMKGHPLFEQTGEPVFIPSSMSTPAYLGVGTNQNDSSFFSASHGTGRRAKTETESPKDKDELFKNMEKAQVKLYNAKSSGVIMQDSSYYKDVEEVISGMEDNNIINSVVKMQPVAVLMY